MSCDCDCACDLPAPVVSVVSTPVVETNFDILEGELLWDPGSLADGEGATSAPCTVAGALIGDFTLLGAPYDLQGITATCYVSATNEITIRLQNETGGAIDLDNGAWKVGVLQVS